VIHGAIHKARPDVGCVLHTHTRAGMAVAAMKCGLLPLSQTSIRFVGHIGYHDYEGPAIDVNERERLVRDLGAHNAMIMRNHGLLTCGPSIQGTVQYNVSARTVVPLTGRRDGRAHRAHHAGRERARPYRESLSARHRRPYGVLEWPAMLRLLAAEEKNSGYPPYWQ
jgi:rhamnose utilization protein RhaD (predicted bifunctional aldolase and dehydrogenase)